MQFFYQNTPDESGDRKTDSNGADNDCNVLFSNNTNDKVVPFIEERNNHLINRTDESNLNDICIAALEEVDSI